MTTAFHLFFGIVLVANLATLGVLAWKFLKQVRRTALRNKVLRAMPPWERDNWSATEWHQRMIMKLYDTKPEERPIIISIIRTENGDGALAASHPKGWSGDASNYAQGAGLEILKTISGAIALMELRGNKHCLTTLLVLLEEERDRIEEIRNKQQQPL